MNIGIDFGSTYSTVSKYNKSTDNVEAITFSEGEPASIPSVVSISKKRGQVTCGKGAKDQVGKKTVRIFEAFKMLLTEGNQEMLRRRGYDSEYTPRVVTRLFLESTLRGVMQREELDGENCEGFENVVICVPEIWNSKPKAWDGRRILREILNSEIQIPVGHVQVVTEPEAASAFIAYNFEKETGRRFNGHLLLIDYGGGTLDLTLTQLTSEGNGTMEIAYREGGGAGENHPDDRGNGNIGSAGIAYMQNVVCRAIMDQGLLEDGHLDYTNPDFLTAVKDLETQMKNSDRIRDIEDVFGSYGSYNKLKNILKDDDETFVFLEYDGDELPVTFQHLYLSYKEVIEPILAREIELINEKVKGHISADPCEPAAGMRDDFKIALVGGFGSFYLVKQQIAEIYKLDANPEIDLRTKNISANKREQAISLGAALLAAGKVVQQKTARFSLGVYASDTFYYGIKCYQKVEPGRIYFICRDDNLPDVPNNRVVYGGLRGNIQEFVVEFSSRPNHGGKMKMKQEMLDRMEKLPKYGFWHVGFSMDERDVITFHVVPYMPLPGMQSFGNADQIELENYTNLFDLTDIEEVTK